MNMEPIVNTEQLVLTLLQKRDRDYLTVKQIVAGLPSAARKRLALTASQSTTALLGKLAPQLGERLQIYKGSRSSYIGYKSSPEDLILRRIQQKPGVSSKQLGTLLPMSKKPYMTALNALLKSGVIICTLRDNHTPCLMLAESPPPISEAPVIAREDTRSALKTAYDRVGQGRDFVRIHRLRDALGWARERFDQVLIEMMADYTVELHGGEPSLLTATELRNSFTDPNGTVYITLSWRG